FSIQRQPLSSLSSLSLHDALPIFACEDGDFTSPFCEPPLSAFDRLFELYRAIGERRGQDFRIGPKLYRMFRGAGFESPQVTLAQDRKSTRLNSSHQIISYAVFCLK